MKTKLLFILPLLAVMISSFHLSAQTWAATIAGMKGGKATVKEILSDSVITAEPGYVITGFRLSIYSKAKKKEQIFDGDNARITEPMRKAIALTKPNDKIYFEYIKATDANGKTLAVSPIGFVIK